MILEVKKGRIWIPYNKKLRGKFIRLHIKNGVNEEKFICVIPRDGRCYVPKEIREMMRIRERVEVLKIEEVINIKRSESMVVKRWMDTSSFIPEKTLSGYDIIATNDKGKYLCWYCAKGRPLEIRIDKKLPFYFSRLLGYYQAEGGKAKLTPRRGRTLSFTNTKLLLIKDFLELSKHLIDVREWNASIRHREDLEKETIQNLIRELEKWGICRIKVRKTVRIREFSVTLWISNSLLAEIIQYANVKIREVIKEKRSVEIFEEYFKGVIAGDGTFYSYRDNRGSMHSWIRIFEGDEEIMRSYKELLENYTFKCRIFKDTRKKMYILHINANWDILLSCLEHNLFCFAPHHKQRLLWTIKNHKRWKTLKYLRRVNNCFDTKDFKKISGKDTSYTIHWLEDREKEGIVKRNFGDKTNILTEKGRKVKALLESIG